MRRSIAITILTLMYTGLLFFGLTTDGATIKRLSFGIDASYFHIPAFFMLALLVRMMFTSKLFSVKHPIIWSFIVSVCFGITTEILQKNISSRSFSYMDLLFNLSGISLYVFLDYQFERWIVPFFRKGLVPPERV